MNSFTFEKREGGEAELVFTDQKIIDSCRKMVEISYGLQMETINSDISMAKLIARQCFETRPSCYSCNRPEKIDKGCNSPFQIVEALLSFIEGNICRDVIEPKAKSEKVKIPREQVDNSKEREKFVSWIRAVILKNLGNICEKSEAFWVPGFVERNPEKFLD